jgi:hypothetical protein
MKYQKQTKCYYFQKNKTDVMNLLQMFLNIDKTLSNELTLDKQKRKKEKLQSCL